MIDILIYALDLLGIHYETFHFNTDPFIILFACILFLCIIALVSFTNLVIYFCSLYVTDSTYFLNKISKYPLLVNVLKWYRTTRLVFIIIEIVLFYISLGSVIGFCFILLYGFSQIH